jgi:hypothetical protein
VHTKIWLSLNLEGRSRRRWENNIEMDLREVDLRSVD